MAKSRSYIDEVYKSDRVSENEGQHRFHCGLLDSSTERPMRVESEKEKVKPLVVAVAVVAMPPNLEEGRETGCTCREQWPGEYTAT
ncbi:hypothetical protein M0804_001648 [Polistes exclamans]|nr:hypothetical protein M0804_001648 [Polistes exclamans]